MNAYLKSIKAFWEGKKIPHGLITLNDGTKLTSAQCQRVIEWGIEHGYEDLYSLPDAEIITMLKSEK